MSDVAQDVLVDRKFDIAVIYNGLSKSVTVRPDETVKQVLESAIRIFSPLPAPHTLALFTESGQELNESQTVRDAGIRPHAKLLLRPSQVKGGGSR